MYGAQLLCTGQTPNASLLHAMDPRTIDVKSGMVRVLRTMQILALGEQDTTSDEANPDDVVCSTSPMNETSVGSEGHASNDPHTFVYPHLFAIGDAADAFGAIKAGHTAYYQGEVAARNVIRLIKSNARILDRLL